jgi:hypothetical protein
VADNVTAPVNTGTFATDDIGGTHYPRTKISLGADGAAADLAVTNPMPTIGNYLPAGTSVSGSITTGGTSQTLVAANTTRRGVYVQNISSGDLWINEIGGAAAVNTAGSWKIAPGEVFSASTNRAITIVGATTGQTFTGIEF